MIKVEIVNIFLTSKGDEFIILLRGEDDGRTLPISIGQLEAQSIFIKLYNYSFPRPLTHDLFKSALDQFGVQVTRVVIHDLVDNTFYARLVLDRDGESFEIDSRPSDAIALALRFSAPVFVEERVMEKSGLVIPEQAEAEAEAPESKGEEPARSPLDQLKARLERAIQEEHYEEAARLRDEINKLTKSN